MIPGSSVLQAIWAGASRAAAWPFRVAAVRATLQALGQMDRRELADIGLTPSDLSDISALPLDRDPTALLAVRARERRTNACAAPPTAWDGDEGEEASHRQLGRNDPSSNSRSGSSRAPSVRTG
ncbi:MAG TPA: DUF1127 domain-containing protein [Roseiarcus sp.]|nr:DUF1127 domain-containing protein [Roseiarcus sp.]